MTSRQPAALIRAASLAGILLLGAALGSAGLLAGCASSTAKRTAKQRYYDALDKRLAGDAKGYFDGLISVANDAPNTRAGRRARAMLQGADLYTMAAIGGVVGAVAIPAFLKYKNRAQQSEAQTELRGVDVAQQAYRQRHGTWCPSADVCRLGPFSDTRYIYFLTDSMIRGGDQSPDKASLITRGRAAMQALGMQPRLAQDGFLTIAIGDLDDDPDLDIWTIDEAGGPFQLANDLEGAGPGPSPFGL